MSSQFRPKTDEDIAKLEDMIKREAVTIFFTDGGPNFSDHFVALGGAIAASGMPDQLKGFTAYHVGNAFADLSTFEADGEKLKIHYLKDYYKDLKNGSVRLAFFKPKQWKPEWDALLDKAIAEYNGKNYNKWELFWFGVGDVLRLIPVIHNIVDLIPNPAYRKDSVVCSQLSILVFKYIPEIYNAVVGNMDISKMQPEELARRMFAAFDYYYDTETQTMPAPIK